MKKNTLVWFGALMAAILLMSACTSAAKSNMVTVKSVTLAESLNANHQAINPKTQFKSSDTIYVSVDVTNRPTTGTLNGKFYLGDQLISEAVVNFATAVQSDISSIGEDNFTSFSVRPSQPWPVSNTYHFDLYVNGTKTGTYPYEVIQ